jgi:hypothetical protein
MDLIPDSAFDAKVSFHSIDFLNDCNDGIKPGTGRLSRTAHAVGVEVALSHAAC